MKSLFTASIAIFWGAQTALAHARPMRPEDYKHLSAVLERKEFQPRAARPDWFEHAAAWLYETATNFLRPLFSWVDTGSGETALPSWLDSALKWVASALEATFSLLGKIVSFFSVFSLLVVGALLFGLFAYWLYRRYNTATHVPLSGREPSDESTLDPFAPCSLLREGKLTESLVAIRAVLRTRLLRRHNAPEGLTDRALPQLAIEDARGTKLYSEVARLFEHTAYGGFQLSITAVQPLCEQYERLLNEEGPRQ